DLAIDLRNDVEQLRIHLGRFVGAPIAQEPVQLLERFLVIAPVLLERDRDVLARMGVVHRNAARLADRDGVLQMVAAEQESENSNTKTIAHAARAEDRTNCARDAYCHAVSRENVPQDDRVRAVWAADDRERSVVRMS